MQTVTSSKAFVAGQAVRAAAPAPRASRAAVVVRASGEESRRAVLGGMLAGVAALAASPAQALDLIDDRKARSAGFDIIYEARDLDLPQATRDGMSQIRADVAAAKARIAESEKRIDSELEGYISKAYWTQGRNELRRQIGTLRFDINALADGLPKAAKKEALAARADFLAAVEKLDYALVKKNGSDAAKALAETKATLDAVIAKLA
ncbi:hypothetical protein CHLNCDRAFT_141328 [Chlorella variabilis]|uniref:Oxygen-evolving enhancer protein 3, chloroplastic n=1 Tax=Chlorella variabilis TaxID=554065 RepID=E1ZSM7_CHLVA|nr:hypothetical protein CHLNCDRAFT_141328 [Chlorella variabilis]EFN51130.1 hypothetical protein CHLNCDRAFT_141328 [Chlorella variabilis]|eukprot:XP_005843232.1 hypothetical protein CHLNCDRAFT_141328 [Chlorella variabilis]